MSEFDQRIKRWPVKVDVPRGFTLGCKYLIRAIIPIADGGRNCHFYKPCMSPEVGCTGYCIDHQDCND